MHNFMTLKNVKTSLKEITKSLSTNHNKRENLIKNTREVVILCSQSIIAVHKGELNSAKIKAQIASKIIAKERKIAKGDLRKLLVIAEQELVEALSYLAIVQKKEIPSAKSLGVSDESYILGLLDCIGELKRQVYDDIRVGKSREAARIFEIMENLYLYLYPFATYDKLIKETRRKLDVNRVLVEGVRAALTEEVRRANLIDVLNKFNK